MSHAVSVEVCRELIRGLESLGVTHAFGLPGTQSVPLFEALRNSRLRTVLATSELAASFMAGAFYRAARRPATLITIPGPGFAYAIPGLAEARADSAAVLHVTFAMPEGPTARFRHQFMSQRQIGRQLAKAVVRIRAVGETEQLLRYAYDLSLTGEPGPVIIELAGLDVEAENDHPCFLEHCASDVSLLRQIWKRVYEAEKPLIYCGQGCVGSTSGLINLAERLHAPVLTTPSARGVVPEDHSLAMCFDPCRGGIGAANTLLDEADLILVMGARFGHNGTAGHSLRFDPAKTCQIDAAVENLGVIQPISLGAAAPVEDFLAADVVERRTTTRWNSAALRQAREVMRRPVSAPPEPEICGQAPAAFFAALRDSLSRGSVVVTDTGQHQIMTRRYYDVLESGGLLMPTDFQSMGFGVPAAIAASLAMPDRPVIALIGDGGLSINGLELATAAALRVSLPVIVFSDGFLNQIRLQQLSDFGVESAVRLAPINIAALADAVGIEQKELGPDLRRDLSWALSLGAPSLLVAPVADSRRVRLAQTKSRVTNAVSQAIGPRATGWLRRMLPRGGRS